MKKKRKVKIKYGNICLVLFVLAGIGCLVYFCLNAKGGAIFDNSAEYTPIFAKNTSDILPKDIDYGDIEQYKKAVMLEQRDGVTYFTVAGHEMLLVNKQYSIPADFGGENAEASAALCRLYAACEADGLPMYTVSGYRSYSTQENIYNNFVNTRGYEAAEMVSAQPGHSEHQTGLAFDVNGSDEGTVLATAFGNTAEFAWLNEHMADYGFILRYPEGGTGSTGYAYEPWHIRYVGEDLARLIKQSGLTVEELAATMTAE